MKYLLYQIVIAMLITIKITAQDTCLQNANNPNNRVISQIVGNENIDREYILIVPINYNANNPTPLIINMHGFGDCATDYAESIGDFYNFNALANDQNIIVAYPQAAYRPEKEDNYWEPGDNGMDNIYENDVYFIEELIADVRSEFNINQDMIYACGYSNGGMMAYSLACNRSNLFSAIGIMSGTMLEENCSIQSSIPIINFHGIADGVLPYEGSQWYQSVEEVMSFWLDQNNIPESSQISTQLNNGKVTLDEYYGGSQNSCMKLYTIYEEFDKPGDHVWFSEEINGITPNEIMWNFFKENCASISTTDESNKASTILYPNPVKDQLEIKNAAGQKYFLHSIDGRLLLKGNIESKLKTINLADMQNGIYTIQIGKQTNRILKID